jgi:hypothetical protein
MDEEKTKRVASERRIDASAGRVFVDRTLVKEVVEAYGPWFDHVVGKILDTWSSAPQAVALAEDTLKTAKDLGSIKGPKGNPDAVDTFDDLASSGVHTARGAMYDDLAQQSGRKSSNLAVDVWP